MCFLYRQSISIVYESKFKYIYRYFIKIDRCFCEILQSLPLRKCGLKYDRNEGCNQWGQVTSLAEVWIEILFAQSIHYLITVTSLAEVWIEMPSSGSSSPLSPSLPLRKCGLKYPDMPGTYHSERSLPLRKCGLK